MALPLDDWQLEEYLDVADAWREDESTRDNKGNYTSSTKILSAIPGKHFTTDNYDHHVSMAGQTKQTNIMVTNCWHCAAETGLLPGDFLHMTAGPNRGRWFKLAGAPVTRYGVANNDEQYVTPTKPPAGYTSG